jgi:TRAP-type uncharacterized transport system substrate-binding protein
MWRPFGAAAISIAVLFSGGPAAYSQTAPGGAIQVAANQPAGAKKTAVPATAASEGETEKASRVNAWTVGIAGGAMEGSFLRFAAELGKALDDGENLRILPFVSYGATSNVEDLLYLKGVDMAITNADVLEEFKKRNSVSNIDKRINFISQLYVSEVHVYARPEIKTLKDLDGKPVSLGVKGAGQGTTAPIVLGRLGIHPNFVYGNSAEHIEKLKTGEIVAIFHNGAKPNPLFAKLKGAPGFHFVTIPYDDNLTDYYAPATLTSQDYPGLIKEGETVETLGIPAVLAVYNWPKATDRYRRVERFIEYYFNRFDKLRRPPFDPKWKEINLAAKVAGWTRYFAAEELLAKASTAQAAQTKKTSAPAGEATGATPRQMTPDQERLFREFLESRKKKQQE